MKCYPFKRVRAAIAAEVAELEAADKAAAAAAAEAAAAQELLERRNAAVALASQSVPATQIHTDVRVSAASVANGKTGCLLDFKRYVPAPWEQQWKDHVGEWQPFMCSVMKGQRARAKQVPVCTHTLPPVTRPLHAAVDPSSPTHTESRVTRCALDDRCWISWRWA